MSCSLRCRWLLGFLLSVALFLPGQAVLGQDKKKPASEEPAAEEPADPYALPEDGTPAELAEFIQKALSSPPQNVGDRKKAMKAMLEAADKILDAKADDNQLRMAVRVKIMFTMEAKELEALAEKLQKAEKPKLARQVRGAVLGRQLGQSMQGSREDVVKNVKKLVGEIKTFLAEEPLDHETAGLAMNAARAAERTGDTQLAADTYTSFAKIFTASSNPKIAGMGKTMEGIVRRLTLVGKKIKVEGKLLDGEQLDWAKYRNKVVLVDFWATWCGPCRAELPNLLKAYEQYHDLGFDIVGISLDRSREDLERFIEKKKIPWTIVFDGDDRNATADYYGVMGIPTMILVGADGKVVSLRARGDALFEELKKLLGPGKEPEAEKEPDAQK